jgi:ABC-type uncharacterized transport system substrate-binding protein
MQFDQLKRREVMTLLGGAAAAWPLAVHAQQGRRMHLVGVIMPFAETDAEVQVRVRAFRGELQKLGWTEGGNLQLDERWTTDDMDRVKSNVTSLLKLTPDVVVATGGRVIPLLKKMTQSIPIVMMTADPVGAGIVESLARPGGNITGFSLYEFSIIGKTLEVLKKLAPNILQAALIYNPDNPLRSLFARLKPMPVPFPFNRSSCPFTDSITLTVRWQTWRRNKTSALYSRQMSLSAHCGNKSPVSSPSTACPQYFRIQHR